MSSKYDLIIIGSGPAGHTAALTASIHGLNTLIIEKDPEMIGGVCLNEGCIPAKSLLHNANLCSSLRKNIDMFNVDVPLSVKMSVLVDKSVKAKAQLKKGLNFLLKKQNVDLITGIAVIKDGSTVSVTQEDGSETHFTAASILIAAGSSPKPLPSISFDDKFIINSSNAIRLKQIPERILIIGGGAIGVEFTSFFNSLGSKVTLVEMESSILPLEDFEITKRLGSVFRKRSVNILTGSSIKNIDIKDEKVNAVIVSGEKEINYRFDIVLVAVGRMPNTAKIAINKAGIKIDNRGFIEVNENLMTAVSGVYAAGDVIKTPMLAHTASAEGEYIASILCGRKPESIKYDNVPNAVYSEIEVASVGLTEQVCKKRELNYVAVKQFFLSNGRAVASDESEGFVKVIVSKENGAIIGAHIIGYKATELIHEFVLARKYNLTCKDIADAIHAHPTFSEIVMEACRLAEVCLNST